MDHATAILAVGSELLSGQVTNRNAAWISARLADMGFGTTRHLTVDDIEDEIVRGLDLVADTAGTVFVTGGLGPTSDDLTRQAVAKWCGEELVYDDASWEHIKERFARLGRDVPEANRQQCYFPKSATVLINEAGTANGFAVTAKGVDVFVLPGPPVEVEAIWTAHVARTLTMRTDPEKRRTLRMWRTIGRGESHLAEIVEPMVASFAEASSRDGLEVAYRAHAPYVELKLRFPEKDARRFEPLCNAMTAALAQWLYETDTQDVPTELVARLASFSSVDVFDGLTQGYLGELLAQPFRRSGKGSSGVSIRTTFEGHSSPKAALTEWLDRGTEAEVALALAGFDEAGRWAIGIRIGSERSVVDHAAPYRGAVMHDRNFKAIAALAAKAWLTLLGSALH